MKKESPMDPESFDILFRLLFEKGFSRNTQYELFQKPENQKIHQQSLFLKRIKDKLNDTNIEHWIESVNETVVELRFHFPEIRSTQTIQLTPTEWELLNRIEWDEVS